MDLNIFPLYFYDPFYVNLIITSDHGMADVNNSRLIQLDYYIPSDWCTLVTDPNRADHASNVFFHILPKKGKLND